MLFFSLAALLVYSLLTFGAVRPNDFILIRAALVSVSGACLISPIIRGRSWSYSHVVLLSATALSFLYLQTPIGLGVLTGLVAWTAACDHEKHVFRFLKFLVLIGIAEALLGLYQNFITPGWIFGYINTSFHVSGTLINRNHFAGLLEMLIPVTVGVAYVAANRFVDFARPYLYLLAAAIMGLAILLSVSRTGIVSFFVTLCFLGGLLTVRRSQRKIAVGFTLTIVALVTAGALWIGIDVVIQRYSELFGEDAILREGRVLLYRDIIKMIMANPFGVGIGNFQDRFRQYQTYRPDLLFDHAHNDYLESAAEWSMPIAIVVWTIVAFALVRSVRLFVFASSAERRGVLLACIGVMFSLMIHSITDFNLQIPSNAMLFFIFVGISLAVPAETHRRLALNR